MDDPTTEELARALEAIALLFIPWENELIVDAEEMRIGNERAIELRLAAARLREQAHEIALLLSRRNELLAILEIHDSR